MHQTYADNVLLKIVRKSRRCRTLSSEGEMKYPPQHRKCNLRAPIRYRYHSFDRLKDIDSQHLDVIGGGGVEEPEGEV